MPVTRERTTHVECEAHNEWANAALLSRPNKVACGALGHHNFEICLESFTLNDESSQREGVLHYFVPSTNWTLQGHGCLHKQQGTAHRLHVEQDCRHSSKLQMNPDDPPCPSGVVRNILFKTNEDRELNIMKKRQKNVNRTDYAAGLTV